MLKVILHVVICYRYTELTARPAASEHAQRYLTKLQQVNNRYFQKYKIFAYTAGQLWEKMSGCDKVMERKK